jgi:hypothetical protein
VVGGEMMVVIVSDDDDDAIVSVFNVTAVSLAVSNPSTSSFIAL